MTKTKTRSYSDLEKEVAEKKDQIKAIREEAARILRGRDPRPNVEADELYKEIGAIYKEIEALRREQTELLPF